MTSVKVGFFSWAVCVHGTTGKEGKIPHVPDPRGGTGPGHCLDLSLVVTETSVREGLTFTSWEGLGKAWSAQVTRRTRCGLRPTASGRRLTQALPCVTGDFFKDPLPDADLYILARVLHDWADDKCSQLLARIGQACKPGGWCDGEKLLLSSEAPHPGGPWRCGHSC